MFQGFGLGLGSLRLLTAQRDQGRQMEGFRPEPFFGLGKSQNQVAFALFAGSEPRISISEQHVTLDDEHVTLGRQPARFDFPGRRDISRLGKFALESLDGRAVVLFHDL